MLFDRGRPRIWLINQMPGLRGDTIMAFEREFKRFNDTPHPPPPDKVPSVMESAYPLVKHPRLLSRLERREASHLGANLENIRAALLRANDVKRAQDAQVLQAWGKGGSQG